MESFAKILAYMIMFVARPGSQNPKCRNDKQKKVSKEKRHTQLKIAPAMSFHDAPLITSKE